MPDSDAELERRMRAELNEILDPCSVGSGNPMGVEEMGLIERLELSSDGCATVSYRLTAPGCLMVGVFRSESVARLSAFSEVRRVEVTFDSGLDWSPDMLSADAQSRRQAHLVSLGLPVMPAR